MTKAIRANVKLSERKAAGIIAELARWKDGELGTKLMVSFLEVLDLYFLLGALLGYSEAIVTSVVASQLVDHV